MKMYFSRPHRHSDTAQVFINRPFSWNFFVKVHDSCLFEAGVHPGENKSASLLSPSSQSKKARIFGNPACISREQVKQLDEEKDFDPCGLEEAPHLHDIHRNIA